MNTCDKEKIGQFILKLRKEKGFTQKELAEKLAVSDKAISKWETGVGMPDVSMLIPIASVFEITVTELLKGERLLTSELVDKRSVEAMIKTTITMAQGDNTEYKKWKDKNITIFFTSLVITILEIFGLFWIGMSWEEMGVNIFTFVPLAAFFAGYFALFAKQRIPAFYDANKVNFYSDGFLRMDIPGVNFNNSNWLPIVRAVCIVLSICMVVVPLLHGTFYLLRSVIPGWNIIATVVIGVGFFVGLFGPIYVVGKKYE